MQEQRQKGWEDCDIFFRLGFSPYFSLRMAKVFGWEYPSERLKPDTDGQVEYAEGWMARVEKGAKDLQEKRGIKKEKQ